MKIFITGGSGFVGQHLIPILIANDFLVYALARREAAIEKVRQLGAIPVKDDLTALGENTDKALKQCDYVLHSAAYMNFTYDPKPYYSINVEATDQLLKMSQANGIRKFVFISAAPVVPGSPIINIKEEEARKGLPRSLYPKTKALAERLVLKANSPDFQTLSLRPPAIWGPDNHHMEELFQNVKKGSWRWIGGSQQKLSTIHVYNLAAAVLAALDSEIGGKAYFVTDGVTRPMRETFSAIIKAAQLEPGDKELPRTLAWLVEHTFGACWKLFRLKSRPPVAPLMIRLMATEFSVNDELARKELGYKNAISYEEGIQTL